MNVTESKSWLSLRTVWEKCGLNIAYIAAKLNNIPTQTKTKNLDRTDIWWALYVGERREKATIPRPWNFQNGTTIYRWINSNVLRELGVSSFKTKRTDGRNPQKSGQDHWLQPGVIRIEPTRSALQSFWPSHESELLWECKGLDSDGSGRVTTGLPCRWLCKNEDSSRKCAAFIDKVGAKILR